MADNNTLSTWDESGVDKVKSTFDTELLDSKIIEFSKSTYYKQKNKKSFYISVVWNWSYSKSEFNTDFRKFLRYSTDKDSLKLISSLENNEISLWKRFSFFREQILSLWFKRENLSKELGKLFDTFYEFEKNDDKFKQIVSRLDELDERELLDLVSSEDSRNKFLLSIFKKKTSLPKIKKNKQNKEEENDKQNKEEENEISNKVIKLLSWLNFEEQTKQRIERKLAKLSTYTIDQVESYLKTIKDTIKFWEELSADHIHQLFEFDIFSDDEKRSIISSFLPVCSLLELVEFWFISKNEVQSKKIDIIKSDLKESKWIDVVADDDDLFILSRDLTLDDITISTKSIDLSLNLDVRFYKTISDSYNSMLLRVREKFKNDNKMQLATFIEKIKQNHNLSWKIENIDDFKEWATLMIKYKEDKEQKDADILFWDIWSISENWFLYKNKSVVFWKNKYNSWIIPQNPDDNINFSSFLEFISSSMVENISVLSAKLKKQKIAEWEIVELTDTLWNWENKDLETYNNDLITKKEQYKNKIIENNEEISKIEKTLEWKTTEEIDWDSKLKDSKTKLDEFKKEVLENSKKLKEINDKLKFLEWKSYDDLMNSKNILNTRYNERKEKLISEWKTINEVYDDEEIKLLSSKMPTAFEMDEWVYEDLNYTYLKNKIDELDFEWARFWLEEWVSFMIDKKMGDNDMYSSIDKVFTISKIDKFNRKITVTCPILNGWIETWSFEEFYSMFKNFDAKRILKVWRYTDMFSQLKLDNNIWKIWEWFDLHHNKIIKAWTHSEVEYDYLVSNEWSELFKIESVNDATWLVTIKTWEVIEEEKEVEEDDWHGHMKKVKKNIEKFWVSTNTSTISIWFLQNYIKAKKMIPRSQDESKDNEHHDTPNWQKRKWSFATWIFSNKSAWEFIKWFKMWVDAIGHYLHEWQEDHAAHFALNFYGKFLPWDLKSDLVARVEWAEKKHMDEYITKLKWVDSPIATEMIEAWLLKSNCPQYKLEAWMLFMLENYWTLYTKKLYKYKWKYLWYEALGWTINDHLFHEVKEDCEKQWIQFTEEELVHKLLKQQCSTDWHHYSWIHRRSRVHKEFEWTWKSWMNKDYDKWVEDWGWKRTLDWRIKWAMWEIKWWTYPNAMWWFEKIVDKWWSMDKLNKIPFIMLFSWIAYGFGQKLADKFKNSMNNWRNLPAARFISLTWDIKLFNEVVVRLSERLEKIHWDKLKWMTEASKSIIAWIWKNTEEEQIKATEKFYDKYWEILTRTMYMLDHDKIDEYNKTDKIIFLEKDTDPIFKRYYDKFKAYARQDLNFTNKDLMTDAFKFAWTSWMDLYKFTRDVLYQDQAWWFRQKDIWPDAWREVERWIETDIKIATWSKDEDIKNKRRIILKQKFREFLAWIMESHGSRPEVLRSINSPTSAFAPLLNKLWIKMVEFWNLWINWEMLLEWKSQKWEELLERFVANALDWKDHSMEVLGWINAVIQDMKTKTVV